MSELVATTPPATEGGTRRLLQFLWPVLALLLLLRLLFAAHLELAPDEAFYWTWTRHLAPGYLDHPPMIACLMWLSTRLCGNTELGVRIPAALLSLASIIVLIGLARRLLDDARAGGYVLLMWAVSPLLAVLGMIFTPDTPAVFFSVCGLACAAIIADRDDRLGEIDRRPFTDSAGLWLGLGLF